MSRGLRSAFVYPGDVSGTDLQHVSGAGRLLDLAEIAAQAGTEVTVIAIGGTPPSPEQLPPGVTFHQVQESGGRGATLGWLTGTTPATQEIAKIVRNEGIEAVCLYGTSLRYSRPLARACQRERTVLIASVNEWGNRATQSRLGYLMLRLGIQYVARRFDGVIAISDLMVRFFSRFDRLRVVRIPSVFDLDELGRADAAHWHRDDDPDHIRLAYAGAIGAGKDAVGNVIRALALLDEPERSRFRFVLAGSSEADVRASLGEDAAEVLAETASLLDFKGFLPRPEVRALLTTADYTVLLRPDEPYANAGFPTKFAESLALGIPVIANLTSDIGHYLHDGVEGYVCPDHTPRSMADTLRRILQEHRYPNTEMRAAAATTGRQAFSTRAYVQEMTRVLTPKAATSR